MRYALFIMALGLLLAGCGGGAPPTPDLTEPFIGGSVGLDLSLVEGMPPAQVYDGDRMPFAMGIGLQNVGEADVGPGTPNPYVVVSLEGFRPSAFGITPADMSRQIGRASCRERV